MRHTVDANCEDAGKVRVKSTNVFKLDLKRGFDVGALTDQFQTARVFRRLLKVIVLVRSW